MYDGQNNFMHIATSKVGHDVIYFQSKCSKGSCAIAYDPVKMPYTYVEIFVVLNFCVIEIVHNIQGVKDSILYCILASRDNRAS